jgi:hypothetical protein
MSLPDAREELNKPVGGATLPHPLHRYAGTYSDPGYGNFTLCDPSGLSDYCKKVLSDFTPFQEIAPDTKSLFAAWSRAWSSHVQLSHSKNNKFLVRLTALYPHGYGKDTSAFEQSMETEDTVFVEFVVRHGKVIGCGLFGTVGQETARERTGVTVEERADVWFTRGS